MENDCCEYFITFVWRTPFIATAGINRSQDRERDQANLRTHVSGLAVINEFCK